MSGRFKPPDVEESVACNLIPMVDIMFLLLLFFMLGADMTQREKADLVLPTASEIKGNEKVKSPEPQTIVNIQHGPMTCALHKSGGYCREKDHWEVVIR